MTGNSGDTASPRGRLSKLIRLFLIVVVATVLGPLIGSLPFLLVTWVQLALSGQGAVFAGALFRTVIFAYFLGGIIAFVAGAIVAITSVWRQPTFATIIVATLIANVGYYVAIPHALLQSLSIYLAVSVFAATICWLLLRRVMSNPSGTTNTLVS